ncbi:phosphoribosylglycinamide formyltransferase [Lewinellaceae bacterium SD302]|nr:phosphoribosylglycinamide formyltransferase [Lewinellaceae bacterium SD302]
MSQPKNIAIFISGGGSNARKIIEYSLVEDCGFKVAMLVASKPDAGGLLVAAEHNIPTLVLDRKTFRETPQLLSILKEFDIDFIVLAGFLWLVPTYLVQAFPDKIVNIHPALLPKFGGKGMYGMNVHRAVKAAGETESGPTIHFVNERYDEGNIIAQFSTPISPEDTAEKIAAKVLALEHAHYAKVVEEVLLSW